MSRLSMEQSDDQFLARQRSFNRFYPIVGYGATSSASASSLSLAGPDGRFDADRRRLAL